MAKNQQFTSIFEKIHANSKCPSLLCHLYQSLFLSWRKRKNLPQRDEVCGPALMLLETRIHLFEVLNLSPLSLAIVILPQTKNREFLEMKDFLLNCGQDFDLKKNI